MNSIKKYCFWLTLVVTLISCEQKMEKAVFNDEEKEWIAKHPSVTLAVDQTYPPLNYKNDDNEIVGYNIDLVRVIEKRTGIKINLEGYNWNNALLKAMNHEVDGILNATPLEERTSRLVFTHAVTQDPQALVTHANDFDKDHDFFTNKKIAAKKNSQQLNLLREKYPNTEIIEVNTLLDGISLLTLNKVDGVYDDLAPLYHFITSNNLITLQISAVEYNNQQSSIGLRNNDPILLSIFNKAIDSITENEKVKIKEKWLQFSLEQDLTYLYVALVVLVVIIIAGGVFNYSLQTLVKQKTHSLQQELEERKRIDRHLKDEQAFSNNMLDAFPGIFFMYEFIDDEARLVRWNKNYETILNYTSEEIMHQNPLVFVHEREHESIDLLMKSLPELGEAQYETQLVTKDKKVIHHLIAAKYFEQNGKPYFLGFGIDITDRMELIEELKIKNDQLLKYSFDNAHKVRGPLARILGLLNLVYFDEKESTEFYLEKIKSESESMDSILHAIGIELYENTSLN